MVCVGVELKTYGRKIVDKQCHCVNIVDRLKTLFEQYNNVLGSDGCWILGHVLLQIEHQQIESLQWHLFSHKFILFSCAMWRKRGPFWASNEFSLFAFRMCNKFQ